MCHCLAPFSTFTAIEHARHTVMPATGRRPMSHITASLKARGRTQPPDPFNHHESAGEPVTMTAEVGITCAGTGYRHRRVSWSSVSFIYSRLCAATYSRPSDYSYFLIFFLHTLVQSSAINPTGHISCALTIDGSRYQKNAWQVVEECTSRFFSPLKCMPLIALLPIVTRF